MEAIFRVTTRVAACYDVRFLWLRLWPMLQSAGTTANPILTPQLTSPSTPAVWTDTDNLGGNTTTVGNCPVLNDQSTAIGHGTTGSGRDYVIACSNACGMAFLCWISMCLSGCGAAKKATALCCCSATLALSVRTWCEPVRSFDDRHQPFRQFALHHVFIDQPQDSLWHLAVR